MSNPCASPNCRSSGNAPTNAPVANPLSLAASAIGFAVARFVLGLDVRSGEEVVLAAEGDGADEALNELEALLQRDLDKEE